jgi:23S rRNA pseudouridine1911/1915/1917 synthase
MGRRRDKHDRPPETEEPRSARQRGRRSSTAAARQRKRHHTTDTTQGAAQDASGAADHANDGASLDAAHPEPGADQVLTAAPGDAGQRLDRFLAQHITAFSRARLQALIRAGAVTRDGTVESDLGRRVRSGETYSVRVPPPEPAAPEAQAIPLSIVYEDTHLIVIDKPKGLAVHPAPGHASGTLVNALIAHCGDSLSGIGGVMRPGIVHRLDMDTTGLMVAAKTDAAHRGLSEQFAAHGRDGRLERAYRAIVWGTLDRPRGLISAALSRSAVNRTKIAVVDESRGRHAVTRYEVLDKFPSGATKPVASLLRLVLETGRTHQVRVHLSHIGHPLLGDQTYGAGFKASARKLSPRAQVALDTLNRQALHAAELTFVHPIRGKRMAFTSPLPPDMAELAAALKED